MKRRIIFLMTAIAILFTLPANVLSAEEYVPGGTADVPAMDAYETWMQFEEPDTHTPAIDADGCLNYALAKLSVRYNLPVEGVDLFTDSYTYYVSFTESILTGSAPKMQQVADVYKAYLTLQDPVYLTGNMMQRMEQAYAVCSENADSREWCYILKMTTASGSDHYVMADRTDTAQQRLYLLDSGSWYIDYLGDEKTMEKGYYITAVYPYHIQTMPGDADGDFRLTAADATLLLMHPNGFSTKTGDADHDGAVNAADAVYIAQAARSETGQAAQCIIQSDDTPLTAAESSKASENSLTEYFPAANEWNSRAFKNK